MDALLVIDLQNGVNSTDYPLYRLGQVITRVNERIVHYRQQNKPIIFIQHQDEDLIKGSESWALFSALDNQDDDHYVGKTHANSFYQTELQAVLKTLNVNALEMCGAQTEYCVDATIKMAHALDYQVTVFSGLTTTNDAGLFRAADKIAHYEAIWQGRFAKLIG